MIILLFASRLLLIRRVLYGPALFIVMFLFPTAAAPAGDAELPQAPSFTVRDINNRLISIDSLLGHGPLIVDFWATWCTHCMREMKALQVIVEKYGSPKVTVLAISQDAPAEITRVKQMVRLKKWPFIVAIDNGKNIAQKFQVTALPSLFVIGSDGKLHAMSRGFTPGDEEKLDGVIRELLNKQ
jgi:peroxiredoxin